MTWSADHYPPQMASLPPYLRMKAIEILNELMRKENVDEDEAIKQSIILAREWEIDEMG